MALDLSALDDLDFLKPIKAPGHAERAPLSSFEEDPDNPRFESMPAEFAALVENVRKHGILQPIVVRRLDNGRLRIRFGARRFRAAVQLALAEAPYVVTEDARQFDDYAQVAENERRTALQPLELATFIAKKLAKGESKSSVAAKLGIHPSAVTHLQCLTSDPPPFVLELYHSGACRSPQYLYRLAKLWRADAKRVEDACAAAGEVGLHLIESLEGIRSDGMGREAVVRQGASADAPAISEVNLTPLHGADRAPRGKSSSSASATSKPSSTNAKRVREPQLFGKVDGRDIELVLSRLPSCAEKIIVRFVNEIIETEIEVSRIILTRLDPGF
jgi:ParB family chromosome partitioning protein